MSRRFEQVGPVATFLEVLLTHGRAGSSTGDAMAGSGRSRDVRGRRRRLDTKPSPASSRARWEPDATRAPRPTSARRRPLVVVQTDPVGKDDNRWHAALEWLAAIGALNA